MLKALSSVLRGLAALAVAASACSKQTLGAELVSASSHGDIETFDTDTGARINYFYMATDAGTGPGGVTFRGRHTMFISVSHGFGGDKVYRFHSSGGPEWTEGLKFNQNRFASPLLSTASAMAQIGDAGIVYVLGSASHDLWAISGTRMDNAGNLYLAGDQTQKLTWGGSTMYFPSEIEVSPLDGRVAIAAGQKIRVSVGLVADKEFSITANVQGLAFDAIGREVTNQVGEKEIHSLVYLLHAKSDQARVDRYDAVTAEPWGADPSDRSNPIFIAPGAGGLAHYATDLEIDHETGDIYVAAANSFRTDQFGLPLQCISRFDRDGKVKGLANNATNAVITQVFNSDEVSIALRPRFETKNYTTKGSYTHSITPGDAGFGKAGLNFVASEQGAGSVITLLPGSGFSPDITVGGAGSSPIQVNVKAGDTLNLNNLDVSDNGKLVVEQGATVQAQAVVNFRRSVLLLAQSVIRIIAAYLEVHVDGELFGTGTVSSPNIGSIIRGLLSPGQSPGKLTFEGDLALTTESETRIELAGTEQGVNYDFIEVKNTSTGLARVLGKIVVTTLNGFQPQATDEFNILTAESAVLLNLQNIANGRIVTADGKGTFAARLANENKTIQLADYQPFTGTPFEAWAQNSFSATERADINLSGPGGDPDQDGVVNLIEFAFNTNPKLANNSKALDAKIDPSTGVTLEFTRRKGGTGALGNFEVDGLRLELKESADLQTWSATAANSASVTANSDGVTERVQVNFQNSAPARFFDLKIAPK